jgi:outer membrane beta-barrel protein
MACFDRSPRRGWTPASLTFAAAVLLLISNPARSQPADPIGGDPTAPAPDSTSATRPVAAPGVTTAAPVADTTAAAPNAALKASKKVRLDKAEENVVRTGPGDAFAIVGVYPKGATFSALAKTGDWYNIRVSDSQTGWIHSSLCKEFDDLSDLEWRPNPKRYSRTGSFVLGGYGGAYAFDRKSNSLVLGGRLGYYVLDRLQAEAGVSWTHVNRPAEIVESLFGLTLEAEDFHMLFYNLNLTFELLPGRQMVPYVTGGVGSSIMRGNTEPSFNFGAGTMLFISKKTATRWEFRAYRFKTGPEDARITNNNVEFSFGTSLLF